METKKLGQEPAFPMVNSDGFPGKLDALYVFEDMNKYSIGMSKRFYAACAAMQGLLSSNPKFLEGNVDVPIALNLCALSFEYADELLRQENQ